MALLYCTLQCVSLSSDVLVRVARDVSTHLSSCIFSSRVHLQMQIVFAASHRLSICRHCLLVVAVVKKQARNRFEARALYRKIESQTRAFVVKFLEIFLAL